jgi:hypothetical protein
MLPEADSAGQPFAGRSFSPNPFASDSGEADQGLADARMAFHELLSVPADQRNSSDLTDAWIGCVDAFRAARLLSPLIAQAGDFGVTDSGAVVEKTQELSVPHLAGPDGRAVAPLFADVAALVAWNSAARPIPVEGSRAALAAASDGLSLMILDPGSSESLGFRRGVIEALATGLPYVPPWRDSDVLSSIEGALAQFSSVINKHRVIDGDPARALAGPEVIVVLGVEPGLNQEDLRAVLAMVSANLAGDPIVAKACDGVGIRVLPV